MKSLNPKTIRVLSVIISIGVCCAFELGILQVHAQPLSPAQLRQKLLNLSNSPNPQARIFAQERRYGNVSRVCLNPRGITQLRAVQNALGPNSNVLEICHVGFDRTGNGQMTNHSFSIFNRKAPHVNVYNGWRDWLINDLGMGNLRESPKRLYSAMIQLTPSEANRLQKSINLGYALQEAGKAIDHDRFLRITPQRIEWVRQRHPDLLEDPTYLQNMQRYTNWNCASFYTEMKIGDHGEPLWQLLGLRGSYSGSPRSLQQALERDANERVVGLCVYHGTMPKSPNNQVFYWEPGSTR